MIDAHTHSPAADAVSANDGHAAAKPATTFCLIVDDEKGLRTLIARTLRGFMVMTDECGDARAALEALRLRNYDLIFLDVSLERSDAIEVIRGLGELNYRGAVQLMSGRDLHLLEEIKRVGERYQLNMLTVLQKPFRIDTIPGILREAGIAQRPAAGPKVSLFEALCAGWIELCYQPKVDMRNQQLVGAEGLVRVVHPEHGVLPPASILPDANESSLLALAESALLLAMRDWTEFARAGNALRIAINVPMVALKKLSIAALVRDNRPTGSRWPGLVLEISEDQILQDIPLAHEIATQLRIYDIHLAIDRFGTGYSSLASLREMPFCEIKLNSNLTTGCADNTDSRMLCQAVIDLAHRFDCHSVAEGVDRPSDLKALVEMGCDLGQGGMIGKPMSRERLCAIIGQKHTKTRAS
jgi:EAL domain-containing protein (putative c-di-GMP-specific phosphodiesterase class I)/ActR/RegA family two-component response regulator